MRAIAVGAGVPVHISHFHGPAHMLTGLVDDARVAGVDLTFDSYPYSRGSSIVAMVALPAWVQVGGIDETLRRLHDDGVRARLRDEWFADHDDLFDRMTLSYVKAPDLAWAEGRTAREAAAMAEADPATFVCDLLASAHLEVSCVFRQPPTNTEADRRDLMRHEAHMAGSDSVYLGSAPHPRGWGAFARFLAVHTRERGDYTWGEAAVHLAGHAARRFGLADRGLLRAGMAADVVALDPHAVADVATYEDPRRPAQGIRHVLVNGVEVLRDGRLTGATPGRALRRAA
jgi:N-acyl-D-amino-acid deacylase